MEFLASFRSSHRRTVSAPAPVPKLLTNLPPSLAEPQQSEQSRVYGSFTTTPPASPTLKYLSSPEDCSVDEDRDDEDVVSRPSSPTLSFLWGREGRHTIPSITRTSSQSSPLLASTSGSVRPSDDLLKPNFAKLRRKRNPFTMTVHCSACGKRGSGYPRCPRCGDMWCSRACRLGGGNKHICRATD